jgi:hypothetical protein
VAQPWERQPGEGSKAFASFLRYRDLLAERSLAKVALEFGKSEGLMQQWSRRWSWVIRAAEWDNEVDRIARRGMSAEIRKMGERQTEPDSSCRPGAWPVSPR